MKTITVLRQELGDDRVKKLDEEGLLALVQWSMEIYHEAQVKKLNIGGVSGSASGAADKTVSDGLYCNCTLPNRNTTGNRCGTCNKMIAGNSVGRF